MKSKESATARKGNVYVHLEMGATAGQDAADHHKVPCVSVCRRYSDLQPPENVLKHK